MTVNLTDEQWQKILPVLKTCPQVRLGAGRDVRRFLEAVRLLMANRGIPGLSRIVAVTLGAQATEVDWDRLLIEHINRGDVQ
jgi:hypothetical protein